MTSFWEDDQFEKENCLTEENQVILEKFTQKKFGKLWNFELYSKGIRILTSEVGFSVWFPQEIWGAFDVQVNEYLTMVPDETSECWLARGNYCFIKIDIDKASVGPPLSEGNPKEYLSFAKRVVQKNFLENPQLYPDSEWNTINWKRANPNSPVLFRWRMGGDFQINFDV